MFRRRNLSRTFQAMKRRTRSSAPSPPRKRQASTTKRTATGNLPSDIITISEQHARYLRLQGSHLINPKLSGSVGDMVKVAADLFGIQAQETASGFVSIWQRLLRGGARCRCNKAQKDPLTLSELQGVIKNGEGLIRIWGQRCTLHIYDRKDWDIVIGAVGEAVIANRVASVKAGRVTGKDASAELDAAREDLLSILSAGRCATRKDLEACGHNGKLQYSTFMCATMEGHGARIDVDSGNPVMAPRSRVVTEEELLCMKVEQKDALVEVARRYFKAYGPATEGDFRYWMSLSAGPSRAAVQALLEANEIVKVHLEPAEETFAVLPSRKTKVQEYYVTSETAVLLEQPVPPPSEWPVYLLFRFDPLLLAHADKSFWIRPDLKSKIWTVNGIINPTILIEGRIAGTWSYTKSLPNQMEFVMTRFPDGVFFTDAIKSALEAQATEFAAFFGSMVLDVIYVD
ncbi:uncharacterized protein SPPG_08174 [Spizellomyces punctatus DAOM BR117]|uniref:Winged helix DNA-binding domain-containing protein n=1 Tax=Spizellomyces punctatus (strain DAOM BR117) TaxID=645134 RepID=A0A0L0H527_SPIPD|nr:uncharacterized protein SPPG_08174 [Spizellomyces punctatus DAOM BR117]KNC96590.1 hypothetical protein SPPG_08174 [Spizellomyces punctatus DAOM BR117]|eukprot:XP_016604630.1 hypothetical protein SPPG_08174 [Spizellomyces punctatus DAOM BR117]